MKITEVMNDISEQDSRITTNANDIENHYCGEWLGATLRRVPLWGREEYFDEDDINFEWPTQEEFDQMRPDVSLESIEFFSWHS
jgi:hypothetical protein